MIPTKNPLYHPAGHHDDITKIMSHNIFMPVFITGPSGSGKTLMCHEICAFLKKDLIRVNVTLETDEDDLLGGYRLINGDMVWQDGPVITAMKNGSLLLLDEIDLASNKIMCLQPVLEGNSVYLKKTQQTVTPKAGFNIIATANTKGQGSLNGKFIGTNILNEAFLDRFPVTFAQEYPTKDQEYKILQKVATQYYSLLDKKEEIEHNKDKLANLAKFLKKALRWAQLIRKSNLDEITEEVISTRRLADMVKCYTLFENEEKALDLILERFDKETKSAFKNHFNVI